MGKGGWRQEGEEGALHAGGKNEKQKLWGEGGKKRDIQLIKRKMENQREEKGENCWEL